MTCFTADNSDFSREQIECVNSAYDEAWGAIKGHYQKTGAIARSEQLGKNLGDAICNEFCDDGDAARLAERALARMWFIFERDAYSLECRG